MPRQVQRTHIISFRYENLTCCFVQKKKKKPMRLGFSGFMSFRVFFWVNTLYIGSFRNTLCGEAMSEK